MRAELTNVAAGIRACRRAGLPARRKNVASRFAFGSTVRPLCSVAFSGRQDAALYVRQGCLTLRRLGQLLAVLNLAWLTVGSVAAETNATRPNLLFILTEDQGAHLGFIGTPGVRTPNMDALARSGVYFRNAYVVYPVCSASKAAIYTGLHNHANGLMNNTPNFTVPADQFTAKELESAQYPLYLKNRVHADVPTLIERLRAAGYYQGIAGKLHVAPNEKFPFDEFVKDKDGKGKDISASAAFIERAKQSGKPWHLWQSIGPPHRRFPNSDEVAIRPDPDKVKLPACVADTPVIRQDWAEYLAAIEKGDDILGQVMEMLRASGQETNTIVVFMGDHGPAFPHGKMTPYELGLRVPLVIRVPWLKNGFRSDALVSELDLTPTLLDLLGLEPMAKRHGLSLKPILEGQPDAKGHQYIFAEISAKGPLPNNGMQERSISDGRWKMIYRENVEHPWRTVQDDSKYWKSWNNRTYDETVRLKEKFPEHFRILAELDPQSLGGKMKPVEFYDL